MWNLRWQVQGYLIGVPTATAADLGGHFARGSNLGSGSLRRAAVETSCDTQLEKFAIVILVNAIAAFEDFTANISSLMPGGSSSQRFLADSLQFPVLQAKPQRPH
jgi:hypothetical protein